MVSSAMEWAWTAPKAISCHWFQPYPFRYLCGRSKENLLTKTPNIRLEKKSYRFWGQRLQRSTRMHTCSFSNKPICMHVQCMCTYLYSCQLTLYHAVRFQERQNFEVRQDFKEYSIDILIDISTSTNPWLHWSQVYTSYVLGPLTHI